MQKKHFTFDVCCSFLWLVLALSFAFLFAFVFALLFTLAFAFVLTFAFHERVDFHWCGVVPVRYAPLSVRLMHRFPLTFESTVPSASSNSGSCGLCASIVPLIVT